MGETHTCHAVGCKVPVAPKFLMCHRHWKLVPYKLQNDVWHHYQHGQEISKQASAGYLNAADVAIKHVYRVENPTQQNTLERERVAFDLCRSLVRRGICEPAFLKVLCLELTGVNEARRLRHVSHAAVDRFILALRETENYLRKDLK